MLSDTQLLLFSNLFFNSMTRKLTLHQTVSTTDIQRILTSQSTCCLRMDLGRVSSASTYFIHLRNARNLSLHHSNPVFTVLVLFRLLCALMSVCQDVAENHEDQKCA